MFESVTWQTVVAQKGGPSSVHLKQEFPLGTSFGGNQGFAWKTWQGQ